MYIYLYIYDPQAMCFWAGNTDLSRGAAKVVCHLLENLIVQNG